MRRVPRIEPPGLVARLAGRLGAAFDWDRVWAVAWVDTIVLADSHAGPRLGPPSVFHELVHVVQYRRLGVEGFLGRYLSEWAAGGFRYGAIGLERDAFELERRFVVEPGRPFAVEPEVARRLAAQPG